METRNTRRKPSGRHKIKKEKEKIKPCNSVQTSQDRIDWKSNQPLGALDPLLTLFSMAFIVQKPRNSLEATILVKISNILFGQKRLTILHLNLTC